jgi:hypothetical protein
MKTREISGRKSGISERKTSCKLTVRAKISRDI